MVSESLTGPSSKGHTIMVYPANGMMGYDICRDLVQGDKKDMCREVMAICCSKEGNYYEKLKELGKHVKVICVDQPDHMDNWKRHLKDERCDCVMICTDPSATRHESRREEARNPNHEQRRENMAQHMARSFECCIEMAAHMHAKAICCNTVLCAEESSCKMWHHMYEAVHKATHKYMKDCECATVFHNMMFECLMMNREDIKQNRRLAWPCPQTAECCPMSMADNSCCCVAAMHHMFGAKMERSKGGKCYITGRDKMTPQNMVEIMSTCLNESVTFQQVNKSEWKTMVGGEISDFEVCCYEEAFSMMEQGKLQKCTEDAKKLMGKEPERMDTWMQTHGNSFRCI